MMRRGLWEPLDNAAHWLKLRRLMPRRLGAWICDRFDLSLGMTRDEIKRAKVGDFSDWTEDGSLTEPEIRQRLAGEGWEPVAPVLLTRTFACDHTIMTGPLLGPPEAACGCVMEEVRQR